VKCRLCRRREPGYLGTCRTVIEHLMLRSRLRGGTDQWGEGSMSLHSSVHHSVTHLVSLQLSGADWGGCYLYLRRVYQQRSVKVFLYICIIRRVPRLKTRTGTNMDHKMPELRNHYGCFVVPFWSSVRVSPFIADSLSSKDWNIAYRLSRLLNIRTPWPRSAVYQLAVSIESN
jgi:hypothetical protein